MKKRLLILFSALCMICLCFALASCNLLGNNTNNGDTGKTEKSLQTITVEVSEGSKYSQYYSNGVITLPADVLADFSKKDFVVTGYYSDNSSGEIAKFTVDVKNPDAAISTIEISVNGNVMYTITVNKSKSILPALTLNDLEFDYTGEAISVADGFSTEDAFNIASAQSSHKITMAEGSVLSATDAGEYSFTMNAADGFAWVDGDAEMTSITVNWKINKKVVTLPTVRGTGSYVYDGTEKTIDLNINSAFENIFTFVNGSTDTRKATYVGSYTCQVMIKEEYQKNYIFPGDHSSSEVINIATWTITPQKIAYPVLTGYKNTSEEEGLVFYHYDYTGSKINITTNVDDCEVLNIYTNEDVVDVIPYGGCYNVMIEFKNDLNNVINNYTWDDNSAISNLTYRVVVDPIDYELPQALQSATLCAEGDYSYPNGTYEFGLDGVALTSDTVALLGDVLVAGESTFDCADDKTYEAGTKTLKYNFTRSKNYNPLEVELSVTINKAAIETSSPNWIGYQDNNNQEVGAGNFMFTGGDQKKEFWIEYSNSKLVEQNLCVTATYNVYYGTTEGVYGETPVMTSTVTAPDRNTYLFEYEVAENTSRNAGYYKTVVTLSIEDNNNYTFVNANGEEQTTYENRWQITKATLIVNPILRGTSQSDMGYSYSTGVDKTVVYDGAIVEVTTGYGANGDLIKETVNASDYIECNLLLNYFDFGGVTGWAETDYTEDVGHYKTIAQVTLKDGVSSTNYDIVVEEKEWYIVPNSFNLTGLTWDAETSYEYGMGHPTLVGVPNGLEVNYVADDSSGYNGGNVGLNRMIAYIQVYDLADGADGVTIVKPDGWVDFAANECVYGYSSDYTVTKKIITIDDFYLTIDGVRLDAPYEFTYDEQYHGSNIETDLSTTEFGYFQIERDDWNADGHGFYNNQCEVGEYVFSGFIYTFLDPDGNFGFDEDDANVELLTANYEYNGETIIDLAQLSYRYVLHFSFTWTIVE